MVSKEKHGCLTACVAMYFDLPESKVPLFIARKDYGKYLRAFFKRRGYKIDWEYFKKKLLSNKVKFYIVQGESPRGKGIQHCVLYRGTRPYYDPHPAQNFLVKPEFIWLVTKIRK